MTTTTKRSAELAAHKLQVRQLQQQIQRIAESEAQIAPSAAVLLRSQARRLQSQIDEINEACIWLLCRESFDLMQAKFPREIRDMVYTYLFDAAAVHVQHEHGACVACRDQEHTTPDCAGCESYSKSCRKTPAKPFNNPFLPFSAALHRLKDVRCVGAYALREMAETWYATTHFVVHVPQTIGSPLQSNLWEQAFEPRDVVRNVTVKIGWKALANFSYTYYNQLKLKRIEIGMQSCLDTLSELQLFTKQTNIRVTFDIGCSFGWDENKTVLHRSIAVYSRKLRALRARGHRIYITLMSSHRFGPKAEALVGLEDWKDALERTVWASEPVWDQDNLRSAGGRDYRAWSDKYVCLDVSQEDTPEDSSEDGSEDGSRDNSEDEDPDSEWDEDSETE